MYIQITTRCNMNCAHCCYNCTKVGEDMSIKTFKNSLKMCRDNEMIPFIGGGEPTLHRHFEKFMFMAMAIAAEMKHCIVGIVTNGSIKERALMLANLSSVGFISAELSWDDFHDKDMVSQEVYKAFEKNNGGIRDVTLDGSRDPLPHGRAKNYLCMDDDTDEFFDDWRGEAECPCENLVIKPDGKVYQCGCDDAPLVGNVNDGTLYTPEFYCCYRSKDFVDRCLDNPEYEYLVYS